MKKLLLRSFIVSAVVFSACSKGSDADPQSLTVQPGSMQLTGLLQRQGVTTYMYGTHILITGSTGYALKSTVLNLDLFIGKTVSLTGNRVVGYPVDGGPTYIDVQTIK